MGEVGARAGRLLPTGKRFFPNRYTEVVQAVVTDINMRSWTVDVVGKLEGRFWADVQAGAQYLHQHNGEGVYCMPEVGATCMLCLPTDASGPFIMAYVSAGQTTVEWREKDARDQSMTAEQYNNHSQQPPNKDVDYSYSSNRPIAKPGDIVMRGRDGNFCILHRGGVLQIGSSELSQRIYVPLTNMMTDISEHYEHHNVAGTIKWGMQPLDYEDRETSWRQCFRVFADDRYCDVRLTVGNSIDPVPLPDGDPDADEQKTKAPIVYELVLIPAGADAGFEGVDGTVVKQSHNQMKMLFKFDRAGNCYTRFEGDVMLAVKKSLFIKVKETFKVRAAAIDMQVTGDATLGADGVTNVKGSLVKLAGGGVGVARLSDMVMIPGEQLLAALTILLNPTCVNGQPIINPAAAGMLAGVTLQGAITTSSTKTETS